MFIHSFKKHLLSIYCMPSWHWGQQLGTHVPSSQGWVFRQKVPGRPPCC